MQIGLLQTGNPGVLAASRATMRPMADLNQLAARLVQRATESQPEESPAQRSGRKGGLKGGKARAEKLSSERRSEQARRAATARWVSGRNREQ